MHACLPSAVYTGFKLPPIIDHCRCIYTWKLLRCISKAPHSAKRSPWTGRESYCANTGCSIANGRRRVHHATWLWACPGTTGSRICSSVVGPGSGTPAPPCHLRRRARISRRPCRRQPRRQPRRDRRRYCHQHLLLRRTFLPVHPRRRRRPGGWPTVDGPWCPTRFS